MPKGGELLVSTNAAKREDRNWVVMAIKDSGVGIQPADQDRIFEPFFTTKEIAAVQAWGFQ
jgi:signal transduction histidine kinase